MHTICRIALINYQHAPRFTTFVISSCNEAQANMNQSPKKDVRTEDCQLIDTTDYKQLGLGLVGWPCNRNSHWKAETIADCAMAKSNSADMYVKTEVEGDFGHQNLT